MQVTIDIPLTLLKKYKDKLINEESTISEYLLNLLRNDLQKKANLGENFSFNEETGEIYYIKRKKIILTKLEYALLKKFIANEGKILSIDDISEVWGKEKVSIYTIRNMIKAIREKTYYGLIKNYSNKGYSINSDTVIS